MTFIDPQGTSSALGLVNSAVTAVKSAFELAKKTSDLDLKHEISTVMDNVLELKAKIIELDEENRDLRSRLVNKEQIYRTGQHGYWFKKGESDPLCPKCYEESGKTIYLPASEPWSGGIRRNCRVCHAIYWEQPMNPHSGQVQPRGYPWS